MNELGGLDDYTMIIGSDGSISYNFPSVIKSLCKVDVTHFPFDKQNCRLKFGSWTYNGYDLNVTNLSPEADLTAYISNGEWDLLAVPAVRHEIVYTTATFPDVTFYIQVSP